MIQAKERGTKSTNRQQTRPTEALERHLWPQTPPHDAPGLWVVFPASVSPPLHVPIGSASLSQRLIVCVIHPEVTRPLDLVQPKILECKHH